MPDVLGEHQFIMLENFETIYISTNQTVPFMSQSFIADSAILCHFMPNNQPLWVHLCLIHCTFFTTSVLLCKLTLALYTRHKFHMSCFHIEISIKASYPKWTHFFVVARVSMFMRNMRDDRILQNFCWMLEAKCRYTTS